MKPCPMCKGTGNAHHTCILNDGAEDSGCLQCGGAGYLDWRNNVFRLVMLALFFAGMAWLLSTGPG